ncbi:MAG: 3-deoxy-7-phosphoheptulonate synthase [Caldisericaceae bacterium]|nr:3-deoxy-7-phosphoheptulonate synthase [Caldisericaceae bacterium]
MILVLRKNISEKEFDAIIKRIEELKLKPHISRGEERTIVGIVGDSRTKELEHWEELPGVEEVIRILKPFKLASREFKKENSVIEIGNGVRIGGNEVIVIAGPCSVESEEQILTAAREVKKRGAKILRGGAFKPRTSPYSFQGLKEKGLELLKLAKKEIGLPVITEALSIAQLEKVAEVADIIQIGARNMQNFALLETAGKMKKPVMLKRGMMATMEELLMSAEYVLSNGNPNVILCERGIRTFEKYTRNTLDISAIPMLKSLSHLPVVSDPSHGTGKRNLVIPVSLASVAAGADGLMVEVHPEPEKALSDGAQSLTPEMFGDLMERVRKVAKAVGREIT